MMETTMIRLNLGSGNRPMTGWTNVDLFADQSDMRIDLDVYPWPFADNSVDEVYTSNCLEHLRDPDQAVREIGRILKRGGAVTIIVPHFLGPATAVLTHRSQWSILTLSIYCGDSDPGVAANLFRQVSCRHLFQYIRQPFGALLNWAANIHPLAWEFLHLPTYEIEWKGVAKK